MSLIIFISTYCRPVWLSPETFQERYGFDPMTGVIHDLKKVPIYYRKMLMSATEWNKTLSDKNLKQFQQSCKSYNRHLKEHMREGHDSSFDNYKSQVPEPVIAEIKESLNGTSKVTKKKKFTKFTKPSININANAPSLRNTLEHCSELQYLGVIYSIPKEVKQKHTMKASTATNDTAKAIAAANMVSTERYEREPLMRYEPNTVFVEPEKFCLVKFIIKHATDVSTTSEERENSEESEFLDVSQTSDVSSEDGSKVKVTSEETDESEESESLDLSRTSDTSSEVKGQGSQEELKAIVSSKRVETFRSREIKGRVKTSYIGEQFMVLDENYHFSKRLCAKVNSLLEEAERVRDIEFWVERKRRSKRKN